MSYHDWHVGMEVVFIGWPNDVHVTPRDPIYLDEGSVHAIEEIVLLKKGCRYVGWNGTTGILPDDVVYIRVHGFLAIASAFRPVQKRKTDISVFTAMLTKTKVPA